MKPIRDLFGASAMLFILAIGCLLFLVNYTTISGYIDDSVDDLSSVGVLSEGSSEIEDNTVVSYEQLIGLLVVGPTVDMDINGDYIDASSFAIDTFDLTSIADTDYNREEIYNSDGEIEYLEFTSK